MTILNDLLHRYLERENQSRREITYTRVIEREHLGVVKKVTVHVHTKKRPAFEEERQAVSPDGKRKLIVSQYSQNGTDAYTYVTILFPTGSGLIYAAKGLHPDIKANWKDNNTIAVQLPPNIVAMDQHRRIQSFEDMIHIEYSN